MSESVPTLDHTHHKTLTNFTRNNPSLRKVAYAMSDISEKESLKFLSGNQPPETREFVMRSRLTIIS